MKHENALSAEAKLQWQKIMAKRPIIAFDFDGTLAPIVHIPNGAFPRPETMKLLSELQKHCDVAVVTGRSIKNLKEQFRLSRNARPTFRPRYLIGNHGLEMPWDSQSKKLLKRAALWTRLWRSEIKKVLTDFSEVTWIEYKQVSLTLHIHRGAKNQASDKLKNWLHANLSTDPQALKSSGKFKSLLPKPKMRLLGGKNVLNILPLDEIYPSLNKGIALHILMKARKNPLAIYAGDDTTDEDVFIQRPLKGQKVIGVRVGQHPDSRAAFYLTKQEKMDAFLQMLIDCAPGRE